MSAIQINFADHFAWAASLRSSFAVCEAFAAEYRYVPSLILAGVFFTLIRLLRERIPIRPLGPRPQSPRHTKAPTNVPACSPFPAQRMEAMREIHTPKNQRFLNSLMFARAFLSNPRQLGAVAPSSRALAGLITAEIGPCSGPVIELGPGTGVFTRALLARGIPEDELALVECDPKFVNVLGLQFPRSRILRLDASRLRDTEMFKGEPAGAVISGLPLLSMSHQKVMAILSASFRHMRNDAAFYQFTYGPRCPVPRTILDRLGLRAKRMGSTYANLPPATVYRIRRRGFRSWEVFNRSWRMKMHPNRVPRHVFNDGSHPRG